MVHLFTYTIVQSQFFVLKTVKCFGFDNTYFLTTHKNLDAIIFLSNMLYTVNNQNKLNSN